MKTFNEEDKQRIPDLWQAILKNTSVLDEETRSKIYTKLQAIKYYYIDMAEAEKYGVTKFHAAFYTDGAVYLLNSKDENFTSIITHELLHGVSDDLEGMLGFHYGYIFSGGPLKTDIFYNNAINEGITEFLACKFLGIEETKTAYFDFVNIAKYFSSAIGYENLMTYYFNNDIEGFKANVQKVFYLKDTYLIDKLFCYMDKVYDEMTNQKRPYDSVFINRCQELLFEMEMNRVMYLHRNEIKTYNDIFRYIDVNKFYNELNAGHSQEFNKCVVYNRTRMIEEFLNYGYNCIFPEDFVSLYYGLYQQKITNLRILIPKQIVTITDMINGKLNSALAEGETPLNFNGKLFDLFINTMKDENEKLDLKRFTRTQKFDFMTNVLYNPYNKSYFESFYPEDLVWYSNQNELSKYTIFTDESFIDYIFDEYENLAIKPEYYKKMYKSVCEKRNPDIKSDKTATNDKEKIL